eukprot:scaffold9128_cov158-Skeletonema_marinoi.AAC.1
MKCQERDKIKISMGIVAAVHKNGGRFLAYDGSKKIFYAEVGDSGARVKTSQALRDAKSVLPIGIPTLHVDKSKELPQESYSNYSCRLDVGVAVSAPTPHRRWLGHLCDALDCCTASPG